MRLFGTSLKLVILDVDGVILDLNALFQKNFEAAARHSGLSVEPFRRFLAAVRAGRTAVQASLHDAIHKFWPYLDEEGRERFAACFRAQERANPYPPITGSVGTIRWFREHRVHVAVCTTNDQPTLTHRFQTAGIELSWFSATSTFEHRYPKPHPRALDPIFEKIPVARTEAVFVGDWFSDFETARGAKVRFVAVLSGGVPRFAFLREGVPGNHILERLADLPGIIDTAR